MDICKLKIFENQTLKGIQKGKKIEILSCKLLNFQQRLMEKKLEKFKHWPIFEHVSFFFLILYIWSFTGWFLAWLHLWVKSNIYVHRYSTGPFNYLTSKKGKSLRHVNEFFSSYGTYWVHSKHYFVCLHKILPFEISENSKMRKMT